MSSRIPPSIIHICGILTVICLSYMSFSKTAVIGASGVRAKLFQLISFHHRDHLSCQVDPSESSNPLSLSCDQFTCHFIYHQKAIPIISAEGTSIKDIVDYFIDEKRQVIIYSTHAPDLSARMVISTTGELLQSIDESPGNNLHLKYLGYQSATGMLVYQHPLTQETYFYQVDAIYLARRQCPSL